ncbi:response regulator [Oscillospiraceae bacterium HV4-5-C5C]|nr:response regulator [Oscillospiraceae bacterium HV4-5-C5C]
MKILFVDDEQMLIQIIKQALPWRALGITDLFTARNSYEAKRIIQQETVHLAVCDIEMPQENGLDLIKWIQGLYPDIVNVILTGHADFNYARSAISLGVYRYLLKPLSFDELESVIWDVKDKLGLEKETTAPNASFTPSVVADINQPAIQVVVQYLHDHFDEVITRNDLEKLVHLNQDYINREFKQTTGYSLMEYIQAYRIYLAQQELETSDQSVADISGRVGYESPAYFTKIFKKRTGMTPQEYRHHRLD